MILLPLIRQVDSSVGFSWGPRKVEPSSHSSKRKQFAFLLRLPVSLTPSGCSRVPAPPGHLPGKPTALNPCLRLCSGNLH